MPIRAIPSRRVYVLVDALPKAQDHAIVIDADGTPLKAMGVIAIIGPRLGVRGYATAVHGDRHKVRFVNGAEGWFVISDPLQWEDTPKAA